MKRLSDNEIMVEISEDYDDYEKNKFDRVVKHIDEKGVWYSGNVVKTEG